jgi:hypothetical protein
MMREEVFPDFEQGPYTRIPQFFTCTLGCFSQGVTTLLAITRMLTIINPFRDMKKRVLISYFMVYVFVMSINNLLMVLNLPNFRSVSTNFIILCVCYSLNALHCLLGFIFSIITVVYVKTVGPALQKNDLKKRASVTIMLMNIVSIISLAFHLFNVLETYLFPHYQLEILTICSVFIPILTSAMNPVIMFIRVQTIRDTFTALLSSFLTLTTRKGAVWPSNIRTKQRSGEVHTVKFARETEIATKL